jgi:hypothetical protein
MKSYAIFPVLLKDFASSENFTNYGPSLVGEQEMGTFKDLTGMRFGLWFVTARAESQNGKTLWRVRCICGAEKEVLGYSLASGVSKSCGCASGRIKAAKMQKRINLINQRFGRLWVVARAGSIRYGKSTSSNSLWECKCTCGNIITVTGKSLRAGTTKSCGCLHADMTCLAPGQSGFNTLLSVYKVHAEKRGFIWELTDEQFRTLVSGACHYCGQQPSQVSVKWSENGQFVYNGIDRLNNAVGYTLGNTAPCCGPHNRMKGTMSVEEFIEQCRKVASRFGISKSVGL